MENTTRSTTYSGAFALMTLLFFIWGGIVSLNDILIPHFKGLFTMDYTETMLIQFCFFGAYFLMAIPASRLIERIGYKKGISAGLLTIGFGALLFLPASWAISYPLFLSGLFTMATGCVILQVVANPYVIILGPPETASSRLNLAQGVNSLATTLAPLLGGLLILGHYSTPREAAAAVEGPYVGLALLSFAVAGVFALLKLPQVINPTVKQVKINVLQFRQLRLGALALMLYVGAEVAIGSFIVNFLGEPHIAGFEEKKAANYIALYWGGLMVGRFVGSVILRKVSAQKVLFVSALAAVVLLGITLTSSGALAMWSMLAVGLFNSIMWSNIFTLSIAGLGGYTNKASGILVMAPVGGAILPLLQGMLADIPQVGLHLSYILPLACYAFIGYYALEGYKTGKRDPKIDE
ncbi:MAG: sugar MFS transporter [Bacteroidota bacterium]